MKKQTFNRYFLIRILLGCIFIVSGGEKLLTPYQNFLYVVQGYEALNPFLAECVARFFPWVEFITGVFLILGLWLNIASKVAWWMFVAFLTLLAQAILRDLSIKECGCFGGLMAIPLPATLLLDSFLLILTSLFRTHLTQASVLSLDQYYARTDKKR